VSTYQNQNQFKQTSLLGQVDFTVNPNIKSAKIDPASIATVLQAGQAFKLVDVAGDELIVDVAAVTEKAYGVAIYNPRKNLFAVGDTIELACVGTVLYLETSAAVARGARVQLDPTGPTVATLTSYATNCQIGMMLSKPTATGQLARVEVNPQDANLSAY
jgi:hypothetical protein